MTAPRMERSAVRDILSACERTRISLRSIRATMPSHPKMLAQLQALGLVVRADALAVHRVGAREHFLVDQAADDLAVFEDERHFARAHFEHGARTFPAGAGVAKTGI